MWSAFKVYVAVESHVRFPRHHAVLGLTPFIQLTLGKRKEAQNQVMWSNGVWDFDDGGRRVRSFVPYIFSYGKSIS